jgi:hypothetical protein
MSKKTIINLLVAISLASFFCYVFFSYPKLTKADSTPWIAIQLTPDATGFPGSDRGFDRAAFISAFRDMVVALKTKGVNTIMFDMSWSSYHFSYDATMNSQNYPANSGWTFSEIQQMAQICRENGMKIVPAMPVLTHQRHNMFFYVYPELMLHGRPWRAGVNYAGASFINMNFVSFNGDDYVALQTHTSDDTNKPPNAAFWSNLTGDSSFPAPGTVDPYNPIAQQKINLMIDELIDAFTVDGVKPEAFNINSDEIAFDGGNWYEDDYWQQLHGTNSAGAFAYAITNVYNHIKAKSPTTEVVMWGDQLDPNWNGAYWGYGPAARGTAGAADLIPKDIIIADWRYEAIEGDYGYDLSSQTFFPVKNLMDKGFRVWTTSWKEVKGTQDLIWSGIIGAAQPGNSGKYVGNIYSTWNSMIVKQFAQAVQNPDDASLDQTCRDIAKAFNASIGLLTNPQCRGTDNHCGTYPSCVDCASKSGFYGTEFRSYSCQNNVPTYSIVNFPTDYSAFWKFEGNANDEKGAANGTLQNGAQFVNEAERGQVLKISSDNDYVTVPDVSSLNSPHNQMTITAWVKKSADKSYNVIYNDWVTNYSQNKIEIHLDGSGRVVANAGEKEVSGNGETDQISGNTQLTNDVWYHVAFVYDNSQTNDMKIYVNGILDAQKDSVVDSLWVSSGKSKYLAGNLNGQNFRGSLDDEMIFGRALSSQEILRVYAEQDKSGQFIKTGFSNADINEDSNINVTDLGILMSDFMKSAASAVNSRSDINSDGNVNVMDLGILMSEWR